MSFLSSKICDLEEACARRRSLKMANRRVILTNGCFDFLHIGHVLSLENAKKFGDSLWVAINSDGSVRALKGAGRPIFNEKIRAYMLAALEVVDGVFVFPGTRLHEEISHFAPDVYVKSGDYNIENLDSQELAALKSSQSEIKFTPFLEGFSTTSVIRHISDKNNL